jgi:hypothetical protein
MTTQDIFKKFGSNWKWASISSTGRARIYTAEPTILGSLIQSPVGGRVSCCEAFDNSTNTEVLIWKRTDFSNGPSYETDKFGIPLPAAAPQFQQPAALPARGYCTNGDCFNEKAIGWNQCETHRPPLAPAPVMPGPAAVTLTTDEAENGGLWAFANHDENYVHVNPFGVVWFDLFKDGPKPRRSYAVEVSGVVNPIERTRSQPQLAPPESGKPYIDAFDAQPRAPRAAPWPTDAAGNTFVPSSAYSDSLNLTAVPEVVDAIAALDKAKAHARHLLKQYNNDDNRQQLTVLQYLAIFGELPQ